MKKGHLIVMTGIDGSGKTTQARLLVEALKSSGLNVSYVWTRWEQVLVKPLTGIWKRGLKKETGYADSRALQNKPKKQKLLSKPLFRWLWLGAFYIDYGLQILVKVRFKLIRGRLIVSDRMFYDSVIDQAINLGSNRNRLLDNLHAPWMKVIFPDPDLVFYIDCPEDVAFSRKVDAPDVQYLIDRREVYMYLAEKYGWVYIDGSLGIDEIAAKIKREVSERMNL